MDKLARLLIRSDITQTQKTFTTFGRFLSYKSDLSLDTLYPGKKQNIFTPAVSCSC